MSTFGDDLVQSLREALAHAKGDGQATVHPIVSRARSWRRSASPSLPDARKEELPPVRRRMTPPLPRQHPCPTPLVRPTTPKGEGRLSPIKGE